MVRDKEALLQRFSELEPWEQKIIEDWVREYHIEALKDSFTKDYYPAISMEDIADLKLTDAIEEAITSEEEGD